MLIVLNILILKTAYTGQPIMKEYLPTKEELDKNFQITEKKEENYISLRRLSR